MREDGCTKREEMGSVGGRMPRSEDYLMQELRSAQKQLVAAKKRKNKANIKYLQFHIAELQKERG
jgi:hypothetical protein